MDLLIKNIKGLVQVRENNQEKVIGMEMAELPVIEDAYLIIDKGKINGFGKMSSMGDITSDNELDASGKFVFPSFVDSHTHIVHAASREEEFVDKIKGASYQEIAKKGGGILNSAKRLQNISEDELYERSLPRVWDIIGFGTGALEIKSGYGLTVEDEIKMLKVAQRIGKETPLTVKATFLGAHAIPKEYSRDAYIKLLINEMIPRVTEESLASYCDVFCEDGFFTQEETERIVSVGKDYGLKPKIHANQLGLSGGVQAGVNTGAISVDHLEVMSDVEIEALKGVETMPTFLPGAAFFLGTSYPPARKMIDAGLGVALASDYNPGSSPCGKMSFILSLACIKMEMTPEEAINAATVNSAYAMDLQDSHGSITIGKTASLFITKEIPSIAYIPYAFGSDIIETIILNGEIINIGQSIHR